MTIFHKVMEFQRWRGSKRPPQLTVSFYRWGNRWSKKVQSLAKITQKEGRRAGFPDPRSMVLPLASGKFKSKKLPQLPLSSLSSSRLKWQSMYSRTKTLHVITWLVKQCERELLPGFSHQQWLCPDPWAEVSLCVHMKDTGDGATLP